MNDDETRSLSSGTTSPQDRIGPYTLLQKLGEGGMGEVWLAEQKTPVHSLDVAADGRLLVGTPDAIVALGPWSPE